MVILPPIAHVGCLSACSTVTSSISARERPRNGPPEAVTIRRSTVPGALAGDQLVQRGVLGVDRDQLGAGGLGERGHELAADDQRLLVGQRDVDALGERDDRRAEAGRADDRVERRGRRRTRRRGAPGPRGRPAPRPRSTPRRRGRRRRGPTARSGARRARGPARRAPRAPVPADRPTISNSPAARSTTSSACVPIEPVEPRMSNRFTAAHSGRACLRPGKSGGRKPSAAASRASIASALCGAAEQEALGGVAARAAQVRRAGRRSPRPRR